MSLIEFKADGTFHEEFRKCEGGEVVGYQYESGTWTLKDGIETTTVTMLNGEAARIEDRYRVELLTDTERRIRSEIGNELFIALRVESFQFPACASGA